MIGAMVASVIAALGGVGDRVAHGGPVVAVLGGIDKVLGSLSLSLSVV